MPTDQDGFTVVFRLKLGDQVTIVFVLVFEINAQVESFTEWLERQAWPLALLGIGRGDEVIETQRL